MSRLTTDCFGPLGIIRVLPSRIAGASATTTYAREYDGFSSSCPSYAYQLVVDLTAHSLKYRKEAEEREVDGDAKKEALREIQIR